MKNRMQWAPSLLFAAAGLIPVAAAAQSTWADRLKGSPTLETETREAAAVTFGTELETGIAGLRETLGTSAERAIESAGKTDGFQGNSNIRIPLPGVLEDASSLLRGAGLTTQVDALGKDMNRAAETAVAAAGPALYDAIQRLTIDDPRTLLIGAPDSTTRLLRRRQGEHLFEALRPSVESALLEANAIQEFSELNQQIGQRVPALGTLENVDLTDYVTQKTLDGMFLLMGEEERRIREKPEARTSDLLREIFGN
jgi:hypothetical protein